MYASHVHSQYASNCSNACHTCKRNLDIYRSLNLSSVAHEDGPIQLPFCMKPLIAQCGSRTSSTWQIILAGDGRVRDGFADGDGTAKARQLAGLISLPAAYSDPAELIERRRAWLPRSALPCIDSQLRLRECTAYIILLALLYIARATMATAKSVDFPAGAVVNGGSATNPTNDGEDRRDIEAGSGWASTPAPTMTTTAAATQGKGRGGGSAWPRWMSSEASPSWSVILSLDAPPLALAVATFLLVARRNACMFFLYMMTTYAPGCLPTRMNTGLAVAV
jgi:hypothetical protein